MTLTNMQVESTAAISKKLQNVQSTLGNFKTYGVPIVSVISAVSLPVIFWAAGLLYDLDGKSRVFENTLKFQKQTIESSVNEIKKENVSLRSLLEKREIDSLVSQYQKVLNEQKDIIISLTERITVLEKVQPSSKIPK